MNFRQAVNSTTKLANDLKDRLQALERNHRKKIQVGDQDQLQGSIDIDSCLKQDYPHDPRWDYVFGYRNKIYYVEVHSANGGGNVSAVIEKKRWLENWRKSHATALDDLKRSSEYYWINTKRVKLPRHKYARQLSKNGIRLQNMLNIP